MQINLLLTHRIKYCFSALLIAFICSSFSTHPYPSIIDDPTACDLDVEVPEDKVICDEEDVALNGIINGNYDEFIWCENGEETGYDLDEVVTVDEATTFTLKAYYLSDFNIIINGDFESGDTAFDSDYDQAIGNCTHGAGYLGCEGVYAVIDDPSLGHTAFDDCDDHTGGGNMMVVNGAASLQNIWCQEVCIDPEAEYIFSAWATSVNPGSPAILQFSIDGNLIGDILTLTPTTCVWEFFETEWAADGVTEVEICVTNQNTATGGNDFAIDDIEFYKRCVAKESFEVTVSDFEVVFGAADDLTCDQPETEVFIDIIPQGDYDIMWDTDDGNIVDIINDDYAIIVDEPGIYVVTATDENGCTREADFEIYSEAEIPEFYLEADGNLDCNNTEVEIYIDYDNNSLEFIWSNSENSNISTDDFLEVTEGGTYTVLGYDPFTGCESTREIDILQDTITPFFNISKSNDLDCINQATTISIDTMSNNILWSGPTSILGSPSNSSIDVTIPGTYLATIINPNGCAYTDSIEVLEIEPQFLYNVNADGLINCASPISEVIVTLDTSIYMIDWINLPAVYNDSLNFGLTVGQTYYYNVIDALNCVKLDSFIIDEDFTTPQNIQVTGGEIDCSQTPVTITANNPNNYTINWEHENGTTGVGDSFEVLQAGDVNYSYLAPNGCEALGVLTIGTSLNTPDVSINGTNLDCNTTSTTLTINTNQNLTDFSWSSSNGILSTADNIEVSEAGTYLLEVISEDGCEVNVAYVVEIDTTAPVIVTPSDIILDCNNPIYLDMIDVQSPYADIVSNGNWYNAGTNEIAISEDGIYEITVIGTNGCESMASFAAFVDTMTLDIDIDSGTLLDCNTTSISPSINSNEPYEALEWNGPNLNSDQEVIEIEEAGTYTLSVVGDNGCSSNEQLLISEDYSEPEFMLTASNIDCAHPTSIIEVNSSETLVTITYLDANDNILGSGPSFETDLLDPISVVVTGENGCRSSDVITVTVDNTTFNFDLEAFDLDCSGDPVFIEIIDNLNIAESNVYDESGTLIGDLTVPITEVGIYTIDIILDNGCEASQTLEIIGDTEPLSLSVEPQNILDCENPETLLFISVNSTYAQLNIYDSQSELLEDWTIFSEAGDYLAEVIAENGCITTFPFTILEADYLKEIEFDLEPIPCSDQVNLNITNFIGGSLNYSINVDGSSPQSTLDYLASGVGIHSIQILDNETGCTIDTFFTIEAFDPILAEAIPEVTITEGQTVDLELIINRDLGELESIIWDSEDLTCNEACLNTTFNGSNSTSFPVFIKDIYGCETELEVRINVVKFITYYVPNVLSIGSSGANDEDSRFTILSKNGDIAEIESLAIFDRWGNKLFFKENFPANEPSEGWDGTYQQASVEQGVYVFNGYIILSDGRRENVQGSLTILR